MIPNGLFFSFYCHFHLVWENWLQLSPLPHYFDEITPLTETLQGSWPNLNFDDKDR